MLDQIIKWLSENWTETLWTVGAIFGIVLAIIKTRESFKKRPFLRIPEESVQMEVQKLAPERLHVTFQLWNKKTWWNRCLISRASHVYLRGTLVHKGGKIHSGPAHDPVSLILYPGTHITHSFKFLYLENLEELIIQVECEEKELKKHLKISEYLKNLES